MKKCQTK